MTPTIVPSYAALLGDRGVVATAFAFSSAAAALLTRGALLFGA